jgi:hypothetical protein
MFTDLDFQLADGDSVRRHYFTRGVGGPGQINAGNGRSSALEVG